MAKLNPEILTAALAGYQQEHERITAKIAEIRKRLGRKAVMADGDEAAPAPKKRVLSAAARKRMAAAQKKRWAEYKKQKKANAAA